MALIHNLYIGHFIPEQGYVRFQDHKPVVTRPINVQTLARLLQEDLGEAANPAKLPPEWGMSITSDYLACDQLGASPAALRVAAEYAQQEGATILDMGSFSLRTPEELCRSTAALPQARPA